MDMKLDNYARDFALWRDWAAINYRAAKVLFETGDPFLLFPAATLGHHALEMYLKSALITTGMTVFDPKRVQSLDPRTDLGPDDCVWGHELMKLAIVLEKRRPEFRLSKQMDLIGYVVMKEPMTVEEGLKIFDPFFSELRYPQEMKEVEGLGGEHKLLLDSLVRELRHARFQWNQSP
jgi:HEPN domain-containing protein